MKIKITIYISILFLFGIVIVSAQNSGQNVCCEKTISGLYCQDVPEEQCMEGARSLPTSCESTAYCRPGICYDSTEGTCTDNTPQIVCNSNKGTWSAEEPPQCELGCCTLGDQAAFVTLVRCKRISASLGLATNYNKAIKNEVECVLSVASQEKGACVFEQEFETTCRFTTRADCEQDSTNENRTISGNFYPGKLCSAEELGTNCGPTERTICVPGKDEVYFVDSCGNPANIYDSNKLNDDSYWANIVTKLESCNAESGNELSASCGNCNYLLGSFCRDADAAGVNTRYGENICADLNCKSVENGKSYKHGESWCVYDDAGKTGDGEQSVGSRFYKHICINGKEVLEQCADFRNELCIEDKIETNLGDFSQAACRVNRWQDCIAQAEKEDCENTDRRDCIWREGARIYLEGASKKGSCVPKFPPGLRFWESEEAQGVCSQADAKCVVTFEKGLTGGEECISNCECLESSWTNERLGICQALGDCGPSINWIGEEGYKEGYEKKLGRYKKNSESKRDV